MFNKYFFILIPCLTVVFQLELKGQDSDLAFRGGDDYGLWNASLIHSTCETKGQISPFNGGQGGGGEFVALVSSVCPSSSPFSPYSGGLEEGQTTQMLRISDCVTEGEISPFSGGRGDGYANRERVNYNCDGINSSIDSIVPRQVCEGEEISIRGNYLSEVTEVYFNNVPTDDFRVIDSTAIVATVPVGAQSGAVSVHGLMGTAYSNVPLIVSPLPVASFDYAQDAGFTYKFHFTGTNADAWFWLFDNHQSSEVENPVYTFDGNDIFPVSLIVSNSCGNDTLFTEVVVNTVGLHIPDVVSLRVIPNPFLDEIQVESDSDEAMDIALFNLPGQLVYSSHNSDMKGRILKINTQSFAPGMYFLSVNSNNFSGFIRLIKGH